MAIVTTVRAISSKRAGAPTGGAAYRALDGAIHHARCGQRMGYQGVIAGGLELQFYCSACHERVVLPEVIVANLPVATGEAVS